MTREEQAQLMFELVLKGNTLQEASKEVGCSTSLARTIFEEGLEIYRLSVEKKQIIPCQRIVSKNAVKYDWPNVQKTDEMEVMGKYKLKTEWRLPLFK